MRWHRPEVLEPSVEDASGLVSSFFPAKQSNVYISESKCDCIEVKVYGAMHDE